MVNNIVDLPLDVLILIYEQIESINDKKNFAQAHPKLWEVIYHSRKNVPNEIIFYNQKQYVQNWKFLLEWWGPHIKRIENVFRIIETGNLIEFAVQHCPNVENIRFKVTGDDIEKLRKNLPKFKMLKKIHVYAAMLKPKTIEVSKNTTIYDLLIILQQVESLRNLYLNFNCSQQSERKELNKLIHLKLLHMCSIQVEHVSDLSNILNNLLELRIKETDSTVLSEIAQHCAKLEKLTLFDYRNTSGFPHFLKLTHLQLRTYRNCFNDFLAKLNPRYYSQLQVLDMEYLTVASSEIEHIKKLKSLNTFTSWTIAENCIGELVAMPLKRLSTRNCTPTENLRLINESSTLSELTCNYHTFDRDFLPKLLGILKARGFKPERPFQLNICTPHPIRLKLANQIESLPDSNLLSIEYRKLR